MIPGEALSHLHAPPEVLAIAQKLTGAGFETWCVGGAVRDALLGVPNADWDLATAALPGQVRKLFRRTVPVGIEHGTIGVLDDRGVMHEVTTFRRDVEHDGRHAVVQFGASLDDDLARRDFTVNAIAFDPIARRIADPFGGQADLAAGIIRAVGTAEARFEEDRLRALRAIRFASRFGFEIAPDTWEAMVSSAPHLTRLSPERVKQEIEKTMEQVRLPSVAFRRWRDSGAFGALVPALADVSDGILTAVDAVAPPHGARRAERRLLRIAVLFSSIGETEAERALRALRFSNQDVAWVGALIGRWRAVGDELERHMRQAPTDAAVRRLVASVGRLRVHALMRLAVANWCGAPKNERPPMHDASALYRRMIRTAFRDPIDAGDLAIDGDDLRRLGVAAGPRMGMLLRALLEDVIEDPQRNSVAWLEQRALDLASDAIPLSHGVRNGRT